MPTLHWSLAKPVWISPVFSWSAVLGLALPLFVISMASQYLPGIAMIKSYGYKPHVNQLIGWTGLTQVLLAPLVVIASILPRLVRLYALMIKFILAQVNAILLA